MNAYEILEIVRNNVNEATAAHWSDKEILRKINMAHRNAAAIISRSEGDWLVKSTTLASSNSIISLPSDCVKVVYIEESSTGYPITLSGTVRERRVTRRTGTTLTSVGLHGYVIGSTIEINQEAYSNNVDLWYEYRVVDLHAGAAGSGSGASTLVFSLDTSPNRNDDYYNSRTVEVVDGTGSGIISTISDYDGGTYTATITGTCASGDNYGTVSQLPKEAMDFVVWHATKACMMKPATAIDPKYFSFVDDNLREARQYFRDFLSNRTKASIHTRYTEVY